MSFNSYKSRSAIINPVKHELDRVPRQFSDYMNEKSTRFSEICKLYLEGMTVDDVEFMKPEDLINIVPPEQYKHKLLMSIMVRRYLCGQSYDNDICDKYDDCSKKEFACDKCNHVCTNPKCNHSCSNYSKIVH